MTQRRVAIVAGGRTPFVKSGKTFKNLSPLALAKHTVNGLIERHQVIPDKIEAISVGVVVPEPGKPNLAREVVLETGLPASIEAQTVSSYCISGLRSITIIADAIASGRINAGIAAGVESLSQSDINYFKEPSSGLLMGEHMELTIKDWGIPRVDQDRLALNSHRNAIESREHLAEQIFPLLGEESDSGPRTDTSLEALTELQPAFGEAGTLTAGNSSPVSDGAAAVLLMSEERASLEQRVPLAFIRGMEYSALHPREGLFMAPALAVPRLLKHTGLKLSDIDLIEIHEAFAAVTLANARAWEQGWKEAPTGRIDWDRVNVCGSSIAVGHPWSATGGRIVTTVAYEMTRRDVKYGLISICAAGAMAGAFLLERNQNPPR